MLTVHSSDKNCFEALKKFGNAAALSEEISETVSKIISEVKKNGDAAVANFTKKFDKAELVPAQFRVVPAEIERAFNLLEPEKRAAMRASAEAIVDFHKKTLPKNWKKKNPHGAIVGETFFPIKRVGLYVPGGQVPLSSTVLMTALPAKLAGVPELVLCTPPNSKGEIANEILAAAKICGIEEIYKVGGVQAIAALAAGTPTIPAVDKIAGPGNAFVVEAKRQLFGAVGIDLLPGPSEVMVVADKTSNARWVAADIITQAEHGSGKEKVYLLALGNDVVKKVEIALEKLLPRYEKSARLREILSSGFCKIVAENVEKAVEIANFVAPEHLEIQTERKTAAILAEKISTAGAMLVGKFSPASLGDFAAGPSHTLPTSRTGRFFSGLQVSDFMRRTSFVKYDKKSLEKARPIVAAFSKMEKLEVHGHSVEIRFEK